MRILIPVGCRSDKGLINPVIKRLIEEGVSIEVIQTSPNNFRVSYKLVETILKSESPSFDIALILGDRVEMCGAAAACFHAHTPIAHVYAGTYSNIATHDDINRHIITMWSEIQFCESDIAAGRVEKMFRIIAKEPYWHVVGITHLDDIDLEDLDDSLVPEMPYDLILYNPVTYGDNRQLKVYEEIRKIISMLDCTKTVTISPNPDDNGDVENLIKSYSCKYYNTLPRIQFLALVKHCRRFITNSSSAIYEAPHLIGQDKIIHIGDRNRDRDKGPFMIGASDRIVEVLRTWYTAKNGNVTGNDQT